MRLRTAWEWRLALATAVGWLMCGFAAAAGDGIPVPVEVQGAAVREASASWNQRVLVVWGVVQRRFRSSVRGHVEVTAWGADGRVVGRGCSGRGLGLMRRRGLMRVPFRIRLPVRELGGEPARVRVRYRLSPCGAGGDGAAPRGGDR